MRIFRGLMLCAVICANLQPVSSQEEELALIDTVTRLQQRLGSDQVAERDRAEKELISMGVEILDYLRPIDEDATSDYRQRLARIRKHLEKEMVNSVSEASRVTVQGTLTVDEVIEYFRRQTGNDLKVREGVIADQQITLNLQDAEFWNALQTFMAAAGLEIDRYGSEKPNQLMLTPRPPGSDPIMAPTCVAKIFRAQIERVDSSINLFDERLNFTSINFLLRWEPRLAPISVDMPLADLQIVDEFDAEVEVANSDRVLYGVVQPEVPEVGFHLQIPRVDRKIENLKSIKAKIIALIPGRIEQFRFEKVGKLQAGHRLAKAGAVVTYEGTRPNENLHGVRISISFDEENNALESHQGWLFQNDVYLEDRQGKREASLSMESFRQDNEMVTVQYYFLNEPGDRTLVYKTPANIIKMPVVIEFKKIPMP